MLKEAHRHRYAVGCFNVDSLAMVQAVLQAAEESRSPVILSFSQGSREFMHPGNIKTLIETVAQDITIPYAIHLDHGKSFEICRDCIDEGFTSVMIDASAHSFEENVAITKNVVRMRMREAFPSKENSEPRRFRQSRCLQFYRSSPSASIR
jgi:fructose-bisphosphate aldolase class II